MTKKISIAPGVNSSSVGVLVATPNDVGPMGRARTWVNAFAGNGVTVRSLGAVEALVGTMSEVLIEGKDATIPEATQNAVFGGLSGHTLIWVAPNHPRNQRSLVLYAGAGAADQEVTINTSDLAEMQLQEIGGVQWVRHPQGATDHRLLQISLFLTIVRLSFYAQIYLCVVANQHRPVGKKQSNRAPEPTDLKAVATQLRDLTGCTVYFNDVGIEFDGTTAVVPTGDTLAPASSTAFTSADQTPLSAKAGTFFHGSMQRV